MHVSPSVIFTLVGYFIFSAAVGAMLPPTHEQERGAYGYVYRLLQRLAANADRLAQTRFGPSLVPPPGSVDQAMADSSAVTTTTTRVERIEASAATYYEQ